MNLNEFFIKNIELKLNPVDLKEFEASSIVKYVEIGNTLLYPGAECDYLPFMITGNMKINRTSENGREVVLYHIKNGDSCILSALGILNKTIFPASAVIEKSGDILLVPAKLIRKYIDNYKGWRDFIFSLYNQRFTLVLELIDGILFKKLDVRLARYLIENMDNKMMIYKKTHQDLADELASSREVISRILKNFKDRSYISYQRNEITILNVNKLKNLSLM